MPTAVRTEPAGAARAESAPRAPVISTEIWLLALIVLIGAALRFATLGSQSYWTDEATTVHELGLSFGGMLHAVANNESTPPLYYILAWGWAKVFGTGEVGLRSLSALAGVAVIPVTYLCGCELGSRRAGLFAAALAALNPFLIWYSQEARAYMLFTLLSGLSVLFFARAWRRGGATRDLVWWAVVSSLALLTHFFAGFLVATEAVWLLLALRTRAAVLASGAVAVVQAALIPLVVGDVGHPLLGWIADFPLSVRIEQVPVALGLGTLYLSSAVTHALVGAAVLAAIVAGLVVLGARGRARSGAVAAATLAATTIFVPLILAEAGRDYYVARNLIGAWIPLAVLIGIACTAWRTLPLGAALGALLLGAFAFSQAKIQTDTNSIYQRPNWRGVAVALGRPSGTRAIVAYDGAYATGPLSIYLPGSFSPRAASSSFELDELDVVGSSAQTVASRLPPGTRLIAARSFGDILLARFALASTQPLTAAQIEARAPSLLGPEGAGGEVLVQRSVAHG
jgi:mannosyltransferase